MTEAKLHDDEIETNHEMVHALVASQFPQWADLALEQVRPSGTVNTIYRLGDDLCVRLPRTPQYVASLTNELRWLGVLAPDLPLAVPEPVAKGEPGSGYPFPWAIYSWYEGDTFTGERVADESEAARSVARFVRALRAIDPSGAPASHRDEGITADPFTQSSIEGLPDTFDATAVAEAWKRALAAPPWDGAAAWTHGDLIPPNVLVRDGNVAAVLDFGGAGIGDPAVDVIPAWTLFGHEGRAAFRDALDVDDGTWQRARALALRQAIRIIPYYRDTHPAFVAMATQTVNRVIDDQPSS